jgi:DNA-binding transcriptional MerR regulator
VRPSASSRARLSIGEVLGQLRGDFPGLNISKIRFLEAEGLIEPERTPSGYRKFSHRDVDRLRYVLTCQREHYLPLKVIREHLDAIDRGLEPPSLNGASSPQVPRVVLDGDGYPAAASFGQLGEGAELRLSRGPDRGPSAGAARDLRPHPAAAQLGAVRRGRVGDREDRG